MIKQEANVLGACILVMEGGCPDEQLLSAKRTFLYLGVSLFMPSTSLWDSASHYQVIYMIRREVTISKVMFYMTCTSRTVNQRLCFQSAQ